jgi:hypothetical protein
MRDGVLIGTALVVNVRKLDFYLSPLTGTLDWSTSTLLRIPQSGLDS